MPSSGCKLSVKNADLWSKFFNYFENCFRPADLRLKLPEVECEDGSVVSPLSIRNEDDTEFEGYQIEPCQDMYHKSHLTLKIK